MKDVSKMVEDFQVKHIRTYTVWGHAFFSNEAVRLRGPEFTKQAKLKTCSTIRVRVPDPLFPHIHHIIQPCLRWGSLSNIRKNQLSSTQRLWAFYYVSGIMFNTTGIARWISACKFTNLDGRETCKQSLARKCISYGDMEKMQEADWEWI